MWGVLLLLPPGLLHQGHRVPQVLAEAGQAAAEGAQCGHSVIRSVIRIMCIMTIVCLFKLRI